MVGCSTRRRVTTTSTTGATRSRAGSWAASSSIASSKDWSGARALEFVGDFLYAAWSDNRLYRFYAPDGLPRWGTRTLVNSGSTSGIPWSSMTSLIATADQRWLDAADSADASRTARARPRGTSASSPNRTLAGAPAVVGCDASINENWGSGSPSSEIPSDSFSARFRQDVTLTERGAAQGHRELQQRDPRLGRRRPADQQLERRRVQRPDRARQPPWTPASTTWWSSTTTTLATRTSAWRSRPSRSHRRRRPTRSAPDSTITTPANKANVPAGSVTATGTVDRRQGRHRGPDRGPQPGQQPVAAGRRQLGRGVRLPARVAVRSPGHVDRLDDRA